MAVRSITPPLNHIPAILFLRSFLFPDSFLAIPLFFPRPYVEFFAANINNDHTRRAYARACSRFFAWCENRGLSLTTIRPFDVAAWVKDLQQQHGAPGVKQQLAAVRMLFDWLVTGQVVPVNPAAAVRGPKHVVKTGKTPELERRRMAQAARQHPGRDLARSARPRPHCHAHLFLRAHHSGAEDEG